MSKWKLSLVVFICVVGLLVIDTFYFSHVRDRLDGGSISEAFINKGPLGELLKENNYLKINQSSADLAAHDMCAKNDTLKGFDYHDSVRLRLFLISKKADKLHVSIRSQNKVIKEEILQTQPRNYYYNVDFRAPAHGENLSIELSSESTTGVNIGHIYIDGQFGRQHRIAYRSKIESGDLSRVKTEKDVDEKTLSHWQQRIMVGEVFPKLILTEKQGLPSSLFKGTFPGKKVQGFCHYAANIQHRHETNTQQKGDIPLVKLYVDHDRWFGQHGVLNNRVRAYGRAWEVPAIVKVYNKGQFLEQSVGLRFHGGIPARSARKYAHNYRIYAREDYGKGSISSPIFNGYDRNVDFKTIVFKNTYHANFFAEFTDFNPFTHALAFDVANQIQAVVPDHFMVDLYLNDVQQPLFLGIEHLSERTIENWLQHDDFELFIYRNENSKESQKLLKSVITSVRNKQGDDALVELKKHYDVDNVIRSIILNAYVANHDFCQGGEVFTRDKDDPENIKVTSINWDLDHSFMQINDGEWSIKGDHIFFPMLNTRYKDNGDRDCERTLIYGWVYQQSQAFRMLFRDTLIRLLNEELSYKEINTVLDKYRHMNQYYYQGKHTDGIKALAKYASIRPGELLNDLDRLETITKELMLKLAN